MRVAKSVLGLANVSVSGRSADAAMDNSTAIPRKGESKTPHNSKLGPMNLSSLDSGFFLPFRALDGFFCLSGILIRTCSQRIAVGKMRMNNRKSR